MPTKRHSERNRGIIMRRFTVATLVMAVALLTACEGDSTGNGGSIVGTYTLQTFNGDNLPAGLPGGPVGPGGVVSMDEFTAGSLRLNSDDTCSLSLTERTTVTDATGNVTVTTDTRTGTCTYSVAGTTIQLDFLLGDPPITGTISGNTITVVEDRNTFVFTK